MDQGNECGLQLGKFKDWLEDDLVECFKVDWVEKKFEVAAGASGSVRATVGP